MRPPDLDAPSRACLEQFTAVRTRKAGATDPTRASAFCRELSAWLDGYFEARIASVRPGTTATLLAVGGYGRREVTLASDIDILLLCPDDLPQAEELAAQLFHPLWDAKLEVGHAVRNLEQCLTWAVEEPHVFASLLDWRYVAGREILAHTFSRAFGNLARQQRRVFLNWVSAQRRDRAQKYGDASQVLEPDCKNGLGGLRDYHICHWAALLDSSTGPRLSPEVFHARDFLLALRNAQALEAGAHCGHIPLDLIPSVAQTLCPQNKAAENEIECFYASLQHHAARLKRSCEFSLGPRQSEEAATKPLSAMESLSRAVHDKRLPNEAEHDTLRLNPPQSHSQRAHAAALLFTALQMADPLPFLALFHETGILEAIAPPWRDCAHTYTLDGSHRYTTAWHSLHTVGALSSLAQGAATIFDDPMYKTWAASPVLRLAALFHDVGKGHPEHERHGARVLRPILDLFELSKQEKRMVRFLVQNHLLLFQIATRRDLTEEETILALANHVSHRERLHALVALAWADSQASATKGWTHWTANLIHELVTKTLRVFSRGEWANGHQVQRLSRVRDQLRAHATWPKTSEAKEDLLQRLGSRYLLQNRLSDILHHLDMLREFQTQRSLGPTVRFWPRESNPGWSIHALSRSGERLFSALAGVLTRHRINIRSGALHRWSDGTTVVTLHTNDPPDPLYPETYWHRVQNDLAAVYSAKLALHCLLEQELPLGHPLDPDEFHLHLDNTASDFFTVIEVNAPDKLGILYRILHALENLQLEIAWAAVDSAGQRATDTFYIRDTRGEKLTAVEQKQTVFRTLTHSLGSSNW
ncbi:MAG: HD domain-containing protein [Thermodesulfobacteriota bacterium]